MQESASFWSDIKNLEERLAASPDSLCFARLSDVYLKVGLIDDALHVARQGTMKHPRYLSGQRALSLACHAKGLDDEALAALKLVTEALPEDVLSQKLLGRLFAEAGNRHAASQAFRTALEFAPDDVECRIEMESLKRSAGGSESALEADDDEEIIEDLEMLEDYDIGEEDQEEAVIWPKETPSEPDIPAVPHYDPLSTGTVAELYVRQGFTHKALEIYRAILVDNPADYAISERVAELEALEAGPSEQYAEFDDTFEMESDDDSAFSMPDEVFLEKAGPVALPATDLISGFESRQASADDCRYDSSISLAPSEGIVDNTLSTLDVWLENIRRIKSCRSEIY
jgi:tetratricopeptide (TPR) repeat protein